MVIQSKFAIYSHPIHSRSPPVFHMHIFKERKHDDNAKDIVRNEGRLTARVIKGQRQSCAP